jgi:hypothetical protein
MQSKGTQALKQNTTLCIIVVESQATVAAAVKRQAKVDFNSHDVRKPKIWKGKADVKC